MNSATEELRRLLDERGAHWREGEDERKTLWESNGLTWEYFNDENGDAWLGFLGVCESDVSPEQAIAATLDGGECVRVRDDVSGLDVPHNGWYVCSKCGEPLPIMNRYCGGCGAIVRKVDA